MKKWILSVVALLAALSAQPNPADAQSTHTATLDEALSLRIIYGPRISPDGRYVVYTQRETNWKDNSFVAQLWLVDVSTGKSIQLTRGKKSADGAAWSPDGNWIAFVTEREPVAIEPLSVEEKEKEKEKDKEKEKKTEGKDKKDADSSGKPADRQLWLISPLGGEAWQLTKSENNIENFRWSKDSKFIAFSADAPESKAAKDRKEKYSDYQVFEKDYRQNQLWTIDVTAATKSFLPADAKRILTDLSLNVHNFSWSPDSTKIAFSASPNPNLSSSGERDIYLLDLSNNNSVTKIVALLARTPILFFLRTANSSPSQPRWRSPTTTTPTNTLPSSIFPRCSASPRPRRPMFAILPARSTKIPTSLTGARMAFISARNKRPARISSASIRKPAKSSASVRQTPCSLKTRP